MPAIQLLADFDTDGYVVEPFGVKGLAELTLRAMLASSTVNAYFAYTPAAAQSLRNAAKNIRKATGESFTFAKLGKSYREVSYPITRTKKDGTTKTITITRQFLNVEAIRVVNVAAEANAAMADDSGGVENDSN